MSSWTNFDGYLRLELGPVSFLGEGVYSSGSITGKVMLSSGGWEVIPSKAFFFFNKFEPGSPVAEETWVVWSFSKNFCYNCKSLETWVGGVPAKDSYWVNDYTV